MVQRKTYSYTEYDPTKSTVVKDALEKKNSAESDYTTYANKGYEMSKDVENAYKTKSQYENAVKNYGDFSYGNQAMFDDVMNRILNREKFSYDINGDALYQQYKDKYINQGKMAMADTMGQAAAMTGGYGNSYSASVGNQAYQASLQQLNDVIPELYQMAYDRYNQEGQDLYNQYGLLSDDRNTQYGMWSDGYNRAVSDRSYYSTEADNAFNKDYGMWVDKGTMLNNNRTYYGNEYNNAYTRDFNEHTTKEGYKYQDVADANAFAQWQANLAETQRQHNETMAFNAGQAGATKNADGTYTFPTKPADTTMSTEDYDYWSNAFGEATTKAGAEALRDQMVLAVGDKEMAYELYYQWEKTHEDPGKYVDTTIGSRFIPGIFKN